MNVPGQRSTSSKRHNLWKKKGSSKQAKSEFCHFFNTKQGCKNKENCLYQHVKFGECKHGKNCENKEICRFGHPEHQRVPMQLKKVRFVDTNTILYKLSDKERQDKIDNWNLIKKMVQYNENQQRLEMHHCQHVQNQNEMHHRAHLRAHLQNPMHHRQHLGMEPLTSEMLQGISEEERKAIIGPRLYPKIQVMEPRLASKITGMFLELDNTEILVLLSDQKALMNKINEAMAILKKMFQEMFQGQQQ